MGSPCPVLGHTASGLRHTDTFTPVAESTTFRAAICARRDLAQQRQATGEETGEETGHVHPPKRDGRELLFAMTGV